MISQNAPSYVNEVFVTPTQVERNVYPSQICTPISHKSRMTLTTFHVYLFTYNEVETKSGVAFVEHPGDRSEPSMLVVHEIMSQGSASELVSTPGLVSAKLHPQE